MEVIEHILTAILALLTGGGLGAWLLKVWQQRHEQATQDRTDVWTRQAALIDRLDRQLVTVQAEQQRSQVAEMACRQEIARLRALGQWLYDLLGGMHANLIRMGGKPDPLPDFPDFGQVSATTATEKEFVQRSTEHSTNLIRKEVQEHKEQEGAP